MLFFCTALVGGMSRGVAQQTADPSFKVQVTAPAYVTRHPKVLLDEAHSNLHTSKGRYQPFVDLLTSDGYQVIPNRHKFHRRTLQGYEVLVIANALGAAPGAPAFTQAEADAVRDWVSAGGALLLIADHAPFGAAAARLAGHFGIQMSQGFTVDPHQHDPRSGNPGWLLFTRKNGLLGKHPILQGRNASERVNRVISFTGQSLQGPKGSISFLPLAKTGLDLEQRLSPAKSVPPGVGRSAAGRAQGIALRCGKGRVVVLGEAAMLSAQVIQGPAARLLGGDIVRVGMNYPGVDNQQLALNMMHWLSGLLAAE